MTQSLKLTLQFGLFPVVESSPACIVLELPGQGNYVRLHLGHVSHTVKVGDKLPLFTEVPYAARN